MATKSNLNVTVDSDLLEALREKNINLSGLVNDVLRERYMAKD
jgi:post-segregation antitoxin (ccd killing protein)